MFLFCRRPVSSIVQGAFFIFWTSICFFCLTNNTWADQLKKLTSLSGVKVVFYDVSGKSVQEVRSSLDRLGPRDSAGRRGDAYSAWKISWNWPHTASKQPDFTKVNVDYQITVTLPRWLEKDSMDVRIQEHWHRFFVAIVKHEMNHVQHVLDHKDLISSDIHAALRLDPELSSQEANNIAHQVLAKIRELDRQYDKLTVHGKTEGVRF